MKVSEVTVQNVADYLRIDDIVPGEIETIMASAKAYIRSYTGLDDLAIDKHEDFVIVLYVLCQSMHDDRTLYVDKNNLNRVVDTILGMHCINLIPNEVIT